MSKHHLMVASTDQVEATKVTVVLSPDDGRVLGSVPTGSTERIDASVTAAKAALGWRSGPKPGPDRPQFREVPVSGGLLQPADAIRTTGARLVADDA